MSAADALVAALVAVVGGAGAWAGVRGQVVDPRPVAAISGLVGGLAYLVLKPMLFGG